MVVFLVIGNKKTPLVTGEFSLSMHTGLYSFSNSLSNPEYDFKEINSNEIN